MTSAEREPETVVAELRPNVLRLILPGLLLVAVVVGGAYFGLRAEAPWPRWGFLGGAAVIALLGFVLPLWHWASSRYTVTTRRTILRDGMFVRHRREILHARVDEVRLRRGPLQQLAGSGDVVLEFGAGSAVLRSVRGPALVQAAITDLAGMQRADREQRRRASGEQPAL